MKIKRLGIFAVSFLAVMMLNGCGSEERDVPVPPDNPQEAPTETVPLDNNTPDPAARVAGSSEGEGLADNSQSNNEALATGNTVASDTVPNAQAVMNPTLNQTATGVVDFYVTKNAQGKAALQIKADLTELAAGDHGFHIHETGDCSAADASSAGDHFNPANNVHGSRESMQSHAGDLGNITADEDGTAMLDITTAKLQLEGKNSVLGKAVVVHSSPDDLVSQPSGEAGDRVACGVIERYEQVDQQVGSIPSAGHIS